MTRHPYGPDELDRHDADLDRVAQELESFAAGQDGPMPRGLVTRIQAAIDAEPEPARGWLAGILAGASGWQRAGRLAAVAAVVAVAVVGALALAEIVDVVRPNVGTSPSPSSIVAPTESPSPSSSPSPTPSPTPTPTLTPSPTLVPTSAPTAAPTASDDDDDDETPEPSESDDGDDDDETPEPSESDNSGPGGG